MINRHNYEEFFLLYVDGELETAQRAAVEEFIQQNPDLAEELIMLQETVLLPEDLSFNHKEFLYRAETGITKANFEEYFLLSVDNELAKEDEAKVEKFVLQHPELQDAFTLLQSTKLLVEIIPYPNKEELYRSEMQRRIIPFGWLKMSSAAAIIFIVAATWMLQGDKILPGNEIVTNQPAKNVIPEKQSLAKQQVVPKSTDQLAVVEEIQPGSKPRTQISEKSLGVKSSIKGFSKTNAVAQVGKVAVIDPAEEKQQKLLPPTEEMTAALIKNKAGTGSTSTDVADRTSGVDNNSLVAANNSIQPQPGVKATVYKEFEEDEESKSIYIGSAEINRNKLKSIFKKASSLFERKDKNNDDENRTISIASFQFKTK